jgi:hypothetical protein
MVYSTLLVFGLPLGMLGIAMLGSHLYVGGSAELLDWKPTRSPKREAELQLNEVQQMLAAQNRCRRERGAPERSLEEVTGHAGTDPRLHDDALWWPDQT